MLTELDELRGQREKLGLESDHVYRLQSKQMTEFQANVRALEVCETRPTPVRLLYENHSHH